MQYNGKNKFIRDVITSLNYIYNNNADIYGIIKKSVEAIEIVNIYKGIKNKYYDESKIIYWSTKGIYVYYFINEEYIKGRQSGALGLFHELGHFYRDIFKNEEFEKEKDMIDPDYDYVEERRVIEDYETPAAKILNQGIRNNHFGKILNTENPISIITKEEYRKEYKRNVPML